MTEFTSCDLSGQRPIVNVYMPCLPIPSGDVNQVVTAHKMLLQDITTNGVGR